MTKRQDETNKQNLKKKKKKKKHKYCKCVHRYSSIPHTQINTSTINAYIKINLTVSTKCSL